MVVVVLLMGLPVVENGNVWAWVVVVQILLLMGLPVIEYGDVWSWISSRYAGKVV